MKLFMTIITLLTLSTAALADNPNHPRRGKKVKIAVKAKKAKLIFESLDAEVQTKDSTEFTLDVKKVGPLKCVKKVNKAETSQVKFHCTLIGKKIKRGTRGGQNRRGSRRRGQSRHRNGSRS